MTGVDRGREAPRRPAGNGKEPEAQGTGAPLSRRVDFPGQKSKVGEGRLPSSDPGQFPALELPYLKRVSDLPWQRSPRLSNPALQVLLTI